MTRIIGTATASDPQGSLCEVRVFAEGKLVLTLLNSVVESYTIEESGPKIPYAEGTLRFDFRSTLPIIRKGALIEIWLAEEDASKRIFRGVVAWVHAASKKDDGTVVRFQARGVAAAIVDASFRGEIGTTISSIVARLVEAAGLRASTDYPDGELRAWVNAQSSYAALRLLAVNMGAVIRTEDDLVEFVSEQAFLARVLARPRLRLDDADVLSSQMVEGHPVKK